MERMQALRKKAGLTLKQLGLAVNKAESTISQYESGRREPDNETLLRIADVLGCSVDYLLGREDTKTPAPEGRGGDEAAGEAADAGAAEISEAQVRAWLAARQGSLTPEDLAELLGLGSADAAIMALCRLLPEPQKAALVEMVRSLAQSQGLLP